MFERLLEYSEERAACEVVGHYLTPNIVALLFIASSKDYKDQSAIFQATASSTRTMDHPIDHTRQRDEMRTCPNRAGSPLHP